MERNRKREKGKRMKTRKRERRKDKHRDKKKMPGMEKELKKHPHVRDSKQYKLEEERGERKEESEKGTVRRQAWSLPRTHGHGRYWNGNPGGDYTV